MLTLTYIVLAVVGCGYVAVAMAIGQLFDTDGGLADGADPSGLGQAAFHFPFFSPSALATLCGSVGAIGLIAIFGGGLSDRASLLIALPGGMLFTYIVTYAAWRLLVSSVGTTAITPPDLVGVQAEILTPIPAGGVGEAAAFVRGQRFTAPAREVDGEAVPRGAVVSVVRLAGATLIVRVELVGVREPRTPR
jgi:membrane protein implicated in regulation of membrane protease activity